jgi:hypothetical protein
MVTITRSTKNPRASPGSDVTSGHQSPPNTASITHDDDRKPPPKPPTSSPGFTTTNTNIRETPTLLPRSDKPLRITDKTITPTRDTYSTSNSENTPSTSNRTPPQNHYSINENPDFITLLESSLFPDIPTVRALLSLGIHDDGQLLSRLHEDSTSWYRTLRTNNFRQDFITDFLVRLKLFRFYLITDLGLTTDAPLGNFSNAVDYIYLIAMELNPDVYSGVFPYLDKFHGTSIRHRLAGTSHRSTASLGSTQASNQRDPGTAIVRTSPLVPSTISVVTPVPITANPTTPVYFPPITTPSDDCPQYGAPHARVRPVRNSLISDDDGSELSSHHSKSSRSASSRSSRSADPLRHAFATTASVSHHRHLDDFGAARDLSRFVPRNEVDHESFSDLTRIISRPVLNYKVTWSGDPLKWQSFKNNIEGWLYQSGLSYMISPRFLRSYDHGGWSTARSFALPQICGKQFAHDQGVIYGALRAACRDGRAGTRYFLHYLDPPDGVAVWNKLVRTFDHGDCLDTKIQVYQRQADTQWTAQFPGEIEGFLELIANAHAQMDNADPDFQYHSKTTDYQLINTVRNRLAGADSSGMIYSIASTHKHKTYNDFMLAVLKWRNFENAHHMQQATSKAKHIHAQTPYSIEGDSIEDTLAFAAHNQSGPRGPYHMDSHSFQALKAVNPELASQWVRERNALMDQQKGSPSPMIPHPRLPSDNHPPPTTTGTPTANNAPPGTLPSQYNRARGQLASADAPLLYPHDDLAETDVCGNLATNTPPPWEDALRHAYNTLIDQQLDDDASSTHAYANTVRVLPPPGVARCHSRAFASHTATGLRPGWFYITTDGGADTMILGIGWRFLEYYPNRIINIVGFNEQHARKSGCRVGTACAVLCDASGREYLALAHQAVENKDSRTSLLSESQMRSHGLIVDSTSRRHTGPNNTPGTQTITSHDPPITIPLHMRSALMICLHRLRPTTTLLPFLAWTSLPLPCGNHTNITTTTT